MQAIVRHGIFILWEDSLALDVEFVAGVEQYRAGDVAGREEERCRGTRLNSCLAGLISPARSGRRMSGSAPGHPVVAARGLCEIIR